MRSFIMLTEMKSFTPFMNFTKDRAFQNLRCCKFLKDTETSMK